MRKTIFFAICMGSATGPVESWDTFTYLQCCVKVTDILQRNTKGKSWSHFTGTLQETLYREYYSFSLFTPTVQYASVSLFPRRHIAWC